MSQAQASGELQAGTVLAQIGPMKQKEQAFLQVDGWEGGAWACAGRTPRPDERLELGQLVRAWGW